MDGRTPLFDLPPRGDRFYFAIPLVGALVIGLLEAGYALMPMVAARATDGRVAALDLDGEGSLCVWVSSFTLLAAAAAALLVYVLRSGTTLRRRLWLWAAFCWTTMSVDECSSLHEAFKEMMTHLTGLRLSHDGTLWWAGAYFAILSATGCVLLAEARRCRAAGAALVGVALCYAVAVLAELGWFAARDVRAVMVEEGCEMMGNFLLLTSMALFARHAAEQLRRAVEPPRVLDAVIAVVPSRAVRARSGLPV